MANYTIERVLENGATHKAGTAGSEQQAIQAAQQTAKFPYPGLVGVRVKDANGSVVWSG